MIASNPVPDDVRVNERPLAQIGALNRTTALWEAFMTLPRRHQLSREILCSVSIEPGDAIVDVTDVA